MKKLKLPLIILGLLLAVIFGISFYAYKKLSADEIQRIATEKLAEEFPGAKVNLGHLSIHFGIVAKIHLQDLKLALPQKKVDLFSIKEIKVKIPIWSILLGQGSIDLNLDSPLINYIEYKNTNTWKLARGKKAEKPKILKKETGKEIEVIDGGGFLLKDLKVNINLKNFQIFYNLYKGDNGTLKITKFKIKDLNLLRSSKFSAETEFKFGKNSLELESHGDLNLFKRELNSLLVIDKINVPTLKIKKLKSNLSLNWGTEGKFNGKMLSDLEKGQSININLKGETKPKGLPKSSTSIIWKNIGFGGEKLNGSTKIYTNNQIINMPNLKFTLGKARGKLALKKSKVINVDFSLTRLNLKQFESFFPKGINVVTGEMKFNLKGWFKDNKKAKLDYVIDVRNGAIKDFKLENHLRKIFSLTPFLTHLNNQNVGSWVTGDFDKLYLKGTKVNQYLNLKNFHMVGIRKKIEILGKGRIAQTQEKGEVIGEFLDHKGIITGGIAKYTGKRALPFKLSGIGFDLKPDYNYSAEILIKRSLNFQTKKATKKMRKKLDKKLKKLFKF